MEVVLVALITAVGGIIVECLRRWNNNTRELKDQIAILTQKVDDLQDEVLEWQEKYYLLLKDIAEKK